MCEIPKRRTWHFMIKPKKRLQICCWPTWYLQFPVLVLSCARKHGGVDRSEWRASRAWHDNAGEGFTLGRSLIHNPGVHVIYRISANEVRDILKRLLDSKDFATTRVALSDGFLDGRHGSRGQTIRLRWTDNADFAKNGAWVRVMGDGISSNHGS